MLRKKILFLIPTLGGGGAERILCNLVNNLNPSFYDITIQTLFKANNKQYLNKNITVIKGKIPQFRGNSIFLKVFSQRVLFKHYIKKRYDVIVSFLEGPATRIVAGCNYETRLINWVHVEQHTLSAAAKSYRNIKEYQKSQEKFDITICVSETVKNDFLSITKNAKDVRVLYNINESDLIIEKAKESLDITLDKNGINLFCVARLMPEKRFDRLIRVFKRLIDDGYPAHLYILGDGCQKHELVKLVHSLDLTKKVHFLGFQMNPYKYISKASIYVCASDREGLSTAVTEALILGIPCVSTDCSGGYELLGLHNEYGVVTSKNDESLFRGICKMIRNYDFYKKKAGERGKQFTKDKLIEEVNKIL